MDQISKSPQNHLRINDIKYKTIYNTEGGAIMQKGTSTIFHVTRIIDDAKMSIVIDIYPSDHLIFISAHPWAVFNESCLDEVRSLNKNGMNSGCYQLSQSKKKKGLSNLKNIVFI